MQDLIKELEKQRGKIINVFNKNDQQYIYHNIQSYLRTLSENSKIKQIGNVYQCFKNYLKNLSKNIKIKLIGFVYHYIRSYLKTLKKSLKTMDKYKQKGNGINFGNGLRKNK